MKLTIILIGSSILGVLGAVGTLETTTDVIGPIIVIALATVAGAVGVSRMPKG